MLCNEKALCHNEDPEQPNKRAEVRKRREREACICWAGHITQVSKRSYLYLLLSTLSWGQWVRTLRSTRAGWEGVVLATKTPEHLFGGHSEAQWNLSVWLSSAPQRCTPSRRG